MSARRTLIAGIGNIFLGDDAFGVEVVRQLKTRPLPAGVDAIDYGIRGFDLACALVGGYDTVILVDAAPRGGAPGSVYLIEPEVPEGGGEIDTHSMDPVKVLRFAMTLRQPLPRILLVGCEPEPGDHGDMNMEMSDPVRAAVGPAVTLIESLIFGRYSVGQQPCTSSPSP